MLRSKRLFALLMALLLALSLFACGAPVSESLPPAETGSSATPAPTFAATPAPTEDLPAPAPTPTPAPADPVGDLLRAAYALKDGQELPGTSTLTGTVLSVDTPWSDQYQNITVTVAADGYADMPVQCYRLKGTGAKQLKPGDVITVSGTLKNYRGTVEFDAGCTLVTVVSSAPAPSSAPQTAPVDRDGWYYDPESVVLYLHYYGRLPSNFITKDEARRLGWEGGTPERFRKGAAIGGDTFSNRERVLPTASGRTYTECDMYTKGESSRGACRLVFSNDGLYFYTDDHYETFTELYVTKDGDIRWK